MHVVLTVPRLDRSSGGPATVAEALARHLTRLGLRVSAAGGWQRAAHGRGAVRASGAWALVAEPDDRDGTLPALAARDRLGLAPRLVIEPTSSVAALTLYPFLALWGVALLAAHRSRPAESLAAVEVGV